MIDPHPATKLVMAVEDAPGGFLVTVNARPAMTPGGNALMVPGRALGAAIRDELAALPGILAGKGIADPAAAPNFRIAAGALDVIAADPEARAALERELAGYAETDLICYRSADNEVLAAREAEAWDPLCAWFEERFGVAPALTTAITARPQAKALRGTVETALAARDPFPLAALALAIKAAGSVIIGLALCEGRVDAETAFAASLLEETYQAEKWGADKEAAAARAVKRLDLEQAARFVELLVEE